mgnify:CR=1 FL=1
MNKTFDNIPLRINFIKDILKNNLLSPLINPDITDTEAFVNTTNAKDTGSVLNKELLDFNDVIRQIGGKLVYIKSGTTGHIFKGLDPDNISFSNYAVKVSAYPKKGNYGKQNDISRPENAELMMLKVLSYFVVNNQTPHIVLPIGTFNSKIEPFLNLEKDGIVENDKYTKFIKKYQQNELHDEVSILISEWANGGDLLEYIRKKHNNIDPLIWKVTIFQLLSVLTIIQTKYPKFRHNDLKANNILLHNIGKLKKNNLFKYKINGCTYIIPNIGFQIKIWDFDFACINGIVNNSKVSAEWTNKINVNTKRNRYYDVHYFFSTLTKKGFCPQFWDSPFIDKSIKDFVKRIIPKKYRSGDLISKRGRLLVNDEYTTPDKILKEDPLFEEFRYKK